MTTWRETSKICFSGSPSPGRHPLTAHFNDTFLGLTRLTFRSVLTLHGSDSTKCWKRFSETLVPVAAAGLLCASVMRVCRSSSKVLCWTEIGDIHHPFGSSQSEHMSENIIPPESLIPGRMDPWLHAVHTNWTLQQKLRLLRSGSDFLITWCAPLLLKARHVGSEMLVCRRWS